MSSSFWHMWLITAYWFSTNHDFRSGKNIVKCRNSLWRKQNKNKWYVSQNKWRPMHWPGLKLKEVALGHSRRVRIPWLVHQPAARGATATVALWSCQRLQLPGHLVDNRTIIMTDMGPQKISEKCISVIIISTHIYLKLISLASLENDWWVLTSWPSSQCYQSRVSWSRGLWLVPLCSPHFRIRSLVTGQHPGGRERGYLDLEDTH